jgi:hypothetical protein
MQRLRRHGNEKWQSLRTVRWSRRSVVTYALGFASFAAYAYGFASFAAYAYAFAKLAKAKVSDAEAFAKELNAEAFALHDRIDAVVALLDQVEQATGLAPACDRSRAGDYGQQGPTIPD